MFQDFPTQPIKLDYQPIYIAEIYIDGNKNRLTQDPKNKTFSTRLGMSAHAITISSSVSMELEDMKKIEQLSPKTQQILSQIYSIFKNKYSEALEQKSDTPKRTNLEFYFMRSRHITAPNTNNFGNSYAESLIFILKTPVGLSFHIATDKQILELNRQQFFKVFSNKNSNAMTISAHFTEVEKNLKVILEKERLSNSISIDPLNNDLFSTPKNLKPVSKI